MRHLLLACTLSLGVGYAGAELMDAKANLQTRYDQGYSAGWRARHAVAESENAKIKMLGICGLKRLVCH